MKEEIAIRLLYTLGVIFAVAAAGLLVSFAVKGRTAAQTQMGTRFGLEVLFLAGIFIPTYFGGPWLLAAACILGVLCASELYGTFEDGGELPWKRSGILIGIGLILLADRVPDVVGWVFPGLLLFYWVVRWLSGTEDGREPYTNWHRGEPNNRCGGVQNCAAIGGIETGGW